MARIAYVREESLNYEAVVISDDATGDSLELQRSLVFDAQDAGLGMDTYCLVRGGAAHYGGVLGWELSEESFEIRLDAAAAAALELPQTTRIALAAGHDLLQLRERLQWIAASD